MRPKLVPESLAEVVALLRVDHAQWAQGCVRSHDDAEEPVRHLELRDVPDVFEHLQPPVRPRRREPAAILRRLARVLRVLDGCTTVRVSCAHVTIMILIIDS